MTWGETSLSYESGKTHLTLKDFLHPVIVLETILNNTQWKYICDISDEPVSFEPTEKVAALTSAMKIGMIFYRKPDRLHNIIALTVFNIVKPFCYLYLNLKTFF